MHAWVVAASRMKMPCEWIWFSQSLVRGDLSIRGMSFPCAETMSCGSSCNCCCWGGDSTYLGVSRGVLGTEDRVQPV